MRDEGCEKLWKRWKKADEAKDGWNSPDCRVPQNLSQSLRREEAQSYIWNIIFPSELCRTLAGIERPLFLARFQSLELTCSIGSWQFKLSCLFNCLIKLSWSEHTVLIICLLKYFLWFLQLETRHKRKRRRCRRWKEDRLISPPTTCSLNSCRDVGSPGIPTSSPFF